MSDHHDRYRQIEANVAIWAKDRSDVEGAVVVGSRARADHPADEFSDLDILLFITDPALLIEDEHWFTSLAPVTLSSREGTKVGSWRDRRVLYDGLVVVDFALLPADLIEAHDSVGWLAASEDVAAVVGRGVRVLVDKTGSLGLLAELGPRPVPWIAPTSEAFLDLVRSFWYHAQRVTKKLLRGETLVAVISLNGSMNRQLLTMIEWKIRADDPEIDTWHGGRFFEQWAPVPVQDEFRKTCAHLDPNDVTRALRASMDLFDALGEATAARLMLHYPAHEAETIRDWVESQLN